MLWNLLRSWHPHLQSAFRSTMYSSNSSNIRFLPMTHEGVVVGMRLAVKIDDVCRQELLDAI